MPVFTESKNQNEEKRKTIKDRLMRKEEITFKNIQEMINGLNAMNRLSTDAEFSDEESEKLKKIIDQIGMDCLEYKNTIHEARGIIRLLVIGGGGMAAGIAGLLSGDPTAFPVVAEALGAGFLMKSMGFFQNNEKRSEEGKKEQLYEMGKLFKRAKELNVKIKNNLLALRLPKNFVEKNFGQIITLMVMKKRQDLENQELIKIRQEMGLQTDLEENQKTLEQLLTEPTSSQTLQRSE